MPSVAPFAPGDGPFGVSIHLRAAGCHCEEPGDEAISHFAQSNQGDCFASLAMTNWWFSPTPARVNGYLSAEKRNDKLPSLGYISNLYVMRMLL
jgi:hypothetical protein